MLRDLTHAIDTFLSIAPQTVGAGETASSLTGVGASRKGYEYAVFSFSNMTPYGTPTGVTVTCKVQESADDSTYTDITSASSSHNVTNTYTGTEVAVNLEAVDLYVRGVMTVQFNGGSGPYIIGECTGILGSSKTYPV